MPFGSFQVSDEAALANAIRFVKEAGADAVKLENARPMVTRARAIVGAGIPVMGHIELTPQSATTALGGFKAQGRTAEQARRLVADARGSRRPDASARAGGGAGGGRGRGHACALDPDDRDRRGGASATGRCSSGTTCSGSTKRRSPRFVKQYADVGAGSAARSRRSPPPTCAGFPEDQHTYAMPEGEAEAFFATR